MTKIMSLSTIAGALLAFGLSAAPAWALGNRTFVSGKGTDAGTCALTAPCRTFAFALTQTAAFGEIDVLDPAGYGPVTITKAISIVNDGVGTAGIHEGSGNGVTINAGVNDSVSLRGLTIQGRGQAGANGILFNTGGNLAIENCVIRSFGTAGINIAPSTGIRALLERVMISKVDDHRTFEKNLNAFCEGGYISTVQRDAMNDILHVGPATMHRPFNPNEGDVSTALDITENILSAIYVHGEAAVEVAARIPPRPPRTKKH
jgi:Domain of unknown function (DUF4145)